MAKYTATVLSPNDTVTANFLAWAKPISDIMLAGGWVQTSDTGQVNWGTVTASAGMDVYEIWRSNDGGGGLSEIYIKIEWGIGVTTTIPQLWVTIGFGSDGSGNITGTPIPRTSIIALLSPATAANGVHTLSVGTGWIAMCLFGTHTKTSAAFTVERTIDNTGTFNNEIMRFFTNQQSATGTSRIVAPSVLYAEGLYNTISLLPANSIQSGKVGLNLMFGQKGGLTNPSKCIFGHTYGDLGLIGSEVQIYNYGAYHTYRVAGDADHPRSNDANLSISGTTVLMRYE